MSKRILNLCLMAAFLAASLFSQGAGSPPNPPSNPPSDADIVANLVAHLTTLLDLTGAQQTQATTIFTAAQPALDAVRTPMQTAQAALQTAVQKNDSAGIAAAATQIGTLTVQQVVAQAKADAAFYAILTPDQQTKFAALKAAGLGGPGPGPGQGGPHGPPPPQQ